MNETYVGATPHREGTRESAAPGTQCGSCLSVHLPARWHRCLTCGSKRLTPTRVDLCGVFESWALPPAAGSDMGDWALGLVRLDAGPMLTVRVRLTGAPMCIGARVVGATEQPDGAPIRFWFEVLPSPDEAGDALAEAAA